MYKEKELKKEKFSFITKLFRSFFWLIVLISSLCLSLFALKDIKVISEYFVKNEYFIKYSTREVLVGLIALLTISLSFVSSLSRKHLLTKIITLLILLSLSFIIIVISASFTLSKDTIFSFIFEGEKNADILQLQVPITWLKQLQEKLVISIPLITIVSMMFFASIANGTKRVRVSNVIMGISIIILFILTLVIIASLYVEKDSSLYKNMVIAISNVRPVIFVLFALSGFCGMFTVFSRNNK